MAARCHDHPEITLVYRRALWMVLAINGAMFVTEAVSGLFARSVSLQADALDFLGDSLTYAITLLVLGMSPRWRAGAALLKGLSMAAFGLWVFAATLGHAAAGTLPDASVMGAIGLLALAANVASALILYRYRHGDANMRSVWLCSRNDAIANVAVMAAAAGVWVAGSGWPDLAVGFAIAVLVSVSAWQIVRQAVTELQPAAARRPSP